MKEAIGGVFLFNIVILFILLFTGIMCLTINRSKAYEVKDQIITLIEENNGMKITSNDGGSNDLLSDITDVLSSSAYRTTSECPDDWDDPSTYIGVDRDGNLSSEPSICIMRTDIDTTGTLSSSGYSYLDESIPACYYTVVIFYKLDIPIIDQIFSFEILGQTKTLYSSEYCG